MKPTRPLFEIGETVILHPLHEQGAAYRGQEAVVMSRRWCNGQILSLSCKRLWCWGYKLTILPPCQIRVGEKTFTDCYEWAELSLKKKYERGDDFRTLMEQLDELLSVEEIVLSEVL